MLTRDSEKKAQKQTAKEEQRAAEQAEKERQEFLASPIGQARTAHEGDMFFQFVAPLSETRRTVMAVLGGSKDMKKTETRHADVLGGIEREGWRLDDVGYVFEQTGSVSRDKFYSSGQTASVTGNIVGVYLFRRAT